LRPVDEREGSYPPDHLQALEDPDRDAIVRIVLTDDQT
jgi:hypothetical protein